MQRLFFNIMSADVKKSKHFYISLFDMKVEFDSNWFVVLISSGKTPFELGILDRSHQVSPAKAMGTPRGVYPTFVVDNVEEVHKRAQELAFDIIETPTDMFYGQRRMLVSDPDGLVVDVSSLS